MGGRVKFDEPKIIVFVVVLNMMIGVVDGLLTVESSPKILKRSGDAARLTLTWTANSSASSSDMDWLGIYNPPDSANEHFIGYVLLFSFCPNWMKEGGSCYLDLPLINMRRPYQFRVFRWDKSEISNMTPMDRDHNPLPSTAHFLARSNAVSFRNLNDPAQLHLAFTSNQDEMRVMFLTSDDIKSYARYGLHEGELNRVAGASANIIGPDSFTSIQVGSNEGGWSSIQSFVSSDKDSDETIAFLFGDMGVSVPYKTFFLSQEESKLTVKWLERELEKLGDKPTFISHIGDMSYARGYEWIWDAFFTQIEPIASKVPYHVCIGNHDYDWPSQPWKPEWSTGVYGNDGGGECGVPYSLKFQMPGDSSFPTGNAAPSTKNLYYSFDLGVVHFLYMSTETNFLQGSDQYTFIEQDLKKVDRNKTPFVVFQGHRPMYTTDYALSERTLREKMIEHLEPLLVKYRVNLVLWGHVHKYERFCPLKHLSCGSMDSEADLPVHVVIGMGGQDTQPNWEPRPDHPADPIYPQPVRSLYRSSEFGYTRLYATREALTLSYIGNHDGQVHDVLDIRLKGVKKASDWIWFLKVGSLFLVGTLLGFIGGYLFYPKRERVQWKGMESIKHL